MRTRWQLGMAAQIALAVASLSSGCFLSYYSVDEAAGGSGAGGNPGTGGNSGTGGSAGSGMGGSGTGGASPCTDADGCPQPAPGACQKATCTSGVCGFAPVTSGNAPVQVPGDCLQQLCDANGVPQNQTYPWDPMNDGNPCTFDYCQGLTTIHSPQPGNCATGVCDGSGNCVSQGCTTASDCAPASECQPTVQCINSMCQYTFAPTGTYCNGGADQCNGAGLCVDCTDNGGCGECCACSNQMCIQV